MDFVKQEWSTDKGVYGYGVFRAHTTYGGAKKWASGYDNLPLLYP